MKPRVTILILVLGASLFIRAEAAEYTNASVVAELSLRATNDLTQISVYLINTSKVSTTLFTGRVGTSGDGRFHAVDLDAVAKGPPFGNGTLVVPELTFGAIQFSAPTTVHWGATFHNMRPTLLELEEGERALYCVFSVPSHYTKGDFKSGRLRFPELPHQEVNVRELEVTVTKCTRQE